MDGRIQNVLSAFRLLTSIHKVVANLVLRCFWALVLSLSTSKTLLVLCSGFSAIIYLDVLKYFDRIFDLVYLIHSTSSHHDSFMSTNLGSTFSICFTKISDMKNKRQPMANWFNEFLMNLTLVFILFFSMYTWIIHSYILLKLLSRKL